MAEHSFEQQPHIGGITPMQRVYGIESELGTTDYRGGGSFVGAVQFFRSNGIGAVGANSNYFLGNGARFYVDAGGHWEYSTPEAQTIADTVAAVVVGEELLSEFVDTTNASCSPRRQVLRLDTRAIDDHLTTWGVHENYLTRRDFVLNDNHGDEILLAHMVTRAPLVGAGAIVDLFGEPHFVIGQKAWGIEEAIGHGNTTKKPIISTRDEPHAAAELFRRLHVTGCDPTMLPWASAIKLATTSLVIRMLEHGVKIDEIALLNPVRNIKEVAADTTLSTLLETKNGKKLRALEIQGILASSAMALIEKIPVPEEERIMASEWVKAVEDLEKANGDLAVLGGRADWSTKWQIIQRQLEAGAELGDNATRLVDRLWGELSANGLARVIRNSAGCPDPLGILGRVEGLTATAPIGRARLRGRIINAAANFPLSTTENISWSGGTISVNPYTSVKVDLKDPYGRDRQEVNGVNKFVARRTAKRKF